MCFHIGTGHKKHSILRIALVWGQKPVFYLWDLEHGYMQIYDRTNHSKWEILKIEAKNGKSQSNDTNFKMIIITGVVL